MWSAAVRLKPRHYVRITSVRLRPDTTYEAAELASLDLASHTSSKAPVLLARHFDQYLVAQRPHSITREQHASSFDATGNR